VTDRPHVVIIGGGFAGLYAAKGLRRAAVRVTLVDRRNHHLFQPMLYQVATAGLSPNDIAVPIRSVLGRARNVEVVLAEAERIDVAAREVHLDAGPSLHYDYCLVAPGARHSYFGRDDWEPYAPGIKSLEDALEVRRRVLLAFERAEREPSSTARQQILSFVVVGGGPTGVEMAGAIAELRRFALARDFRHIDPREATIQLLEGGPQILPTYPAVLAARAKRDLRGLGVEVRENMLVTEIAAEHVEAGGWRIPTRTVVWAAGNQVSPLVRTLGVDVDRQGRARVNADCSIPGHPEVLVLGDAAAVPVAPGSAPVPGVSPAAIQMGQYAARIIRGDLAGHPRPPFRYRDKGQLAVIGRARAVGRIFDRVNVTGFRAWWVWVVIHIAFLIGFRNRVMVLLEWAWAYLRYQPGARLITGETGEYAARVIGRE
jgi:NADH dehydrogenase